MADCLAAADIVISRAGASSLSEIQALGKTAILIPSPNVAENHQYHNAMALVNNDAAIVFEEKDLTANKLIDAVNDLLNDREKLARIGFNAKKMAKLDAKEKICNEILE
jgi:UDP-N-acetylglucosamine--N-acetylmuramyl-(pentapeptide) pyrophosphoryl-undecaprenol N-acetylglucosamine transferase